MDWLEVLADRTLSLRPAAKRVLDKWRGDGIEANGQHVLGEPFWSTLEIAECEELLELTVAATRRLA